MYSPLEQFNPYSIILFTYKGYDLSLTTTTMALLLVVLFLFSTYFFLKKDSGILADSWQFTLEVFINL